MFVPCFTRQPRKHAGLAVHAGKTSEGPAGVSR